MGRKLRLLLIGGCALCVLGVAPTESVAAPAPVWKIGQRSLPTNFVPGSSAPFGSAFQFALPQYNIALTNLGGASVEPGTTIIDTLPGKVTPSLASEPRFVNNSASEEGACEVLGQTVTCTVFSPIPPGAQVTIAVPVNVALDAPTTVENKVTVADGGAPGASSEIQTAVTTADPSFGFLDGAQGLYGTTVAEDGSAATAAGSHPYGMTLEANFPARQVPGEEGSNALVSAGSVRNLAFSLPLGMVVSPKATPSRCSETQLASGKNGEGCPPPTQVGQLHLTFTDFSTLQAGSVGLYNLVPPPGVPAEFGFEILGTLIHVTGGLSGSFHLTAENREVLAKLGVIGIQANLWGNPSDPRHDPLREGLNCHSSAGCSVEPTSVPLLTMPSACSGPLELGASAASWEETARVVETSVPMSDTAGNPTGVYGCGALGFTPTITVEPTSHAASAPTGLNVHLRIPQNEGLNGLATANLKKVVVRLPQGMAVNPPAADGLAACSPGQIGLGNNLPATCPEPAKVGTVEVVTPLLDVPLTGSVYLAQQRDNPFGTLLALYIVAEGEGVVVKIPGRVDSDLRTGQLTATFDENPQLPFSDLEVQFNSGSRAPLVTPPGCGSYDTQAELISWASPTAVSSGLPMTINQGCGGGGFNPGLTAGTENPIAGRYSPFTLRVTRNDGEQNIARVSATLPEGLLAKLAGVPLCADAQAATGDCPASSQVGTTTTGVGAGPQPLYIPQPGKAPTAVYLAGPYRGAPYSLVVKVPAQAGPFDLGTIAVRVALEVDAFTAKVTAASDPLPQILEGIPVAYRDVRVKVDRPNFTINPTSCEPLKVTTTVTSAIDTTATPNQRFQIAGCETLGFKPDLKLSLKGATKRAGHPALKAVVTYPKQGAYANIARAQVGLPRSEFLDQGNLNKVCKQADLRAGTCPKTSIYGHAKAWSPLLDRPLEGPVYLGVGFGYKLPALIADLNGQVRILLKGKVDTTKQNGLRNTFEAVPDAPVSRFVLEMKGGKKYGLLENSENICRKPQHASALFDAQNGKSLHLQPKISNSCRSKGKATRGKNGQHPRG
ncbi:MAG: hypothetical protein ACRDPE_11335 [Solirubrobacterales bacterium]